ncbi:hypothetical protein BDN72DRAFT_780239 [Pluteus cervinus]|uniref:Uncharacterized protein n=1 Tax=Pluteus cervinus TaxID=181527 RepID=A0ACD3A4N5_9AGAR|nr:hypothetical protein BDN72DRAFT_780239 [Pluteus cervinus]
MLLHCAFTQLFIDAEQAPWSYSKWKELTGISHGLFPDDDTLLPKGLTREAANSILSYFDQWKAKSSQDDRVKYSAARRNPHPGLKFWRDWFAQAWQSWGIHEIITSVMTDEKVHPFILARLSGDGVQWPKAIEYITLLVDPVAEVLFGRECFDTSGRAAGPLRPSIRALIQRTWNNLFRQQKRSLKRIDGLRDEALSAFTDLDRDQLTKKKLESVIIKVSRWKNLAEVLLLEERRGEIQEMEAELGRLMVGIGANIKPKTAKKGITTAKMLRDLSRKEDSADLINLYMDLFSSPAPEDSASLGSVQNIPIIFGELPDGGDPGVEVEATMSPEQLATSIGLTNGLPFFFNEYRHQGGATPWDEGWAEQFHPDKAESNPDMARLSLHWHQIAGVHAILRKMFASTPDSDRCCGILVADEVGLGKTFQSAAVIAVLAELAIRQQKGIPLPPLFALAPFLREYNQLPDFPHLIIVPGTLLVQWELELKGVGKPAAFDLFVYKANRDFHKAFWAEGGPWALSEQPMFRRIILASHSALLQDFAELYVGGKQKSADKPWMRPERLPSYDVELKTTLFQLKFLSVVIDEAHEFRNLGTKHSAALVILGRSVMRMVMTATPLQTSTRDCAGMGRLSGIAHFFSEAALEEEKLDATNLRKAKSMLGEDYDPFNDDDDDLIKMCCVSASRRMHSQFDNRIIRRTTTSKDWEGKPLVDLPPCHTTLCVVKLTPHEMAIINYLDERVKESASASNSVLKIMSKSFYLEYRMGVGFARRHLEEPIPKFATLDAWLVQKSTKFDLCARLCKHILLRDDAPEVVFEDGGATFPDVPPLLPGETVLQETKILIYQEFPSLGGLLRNVLDLYGVKYIWIDGQTTFAQRARKVAQFKTDPKVRVLIFSSIGSSGLNLSAASVVIFLDQPWSAQDERQIKGRAHRQPQKKEVRTYHLLAQDTADIILSGLARGKKDMMEAFLSKSQGKGSFTLLILGLVLTTSLIY